MKSKSKRRCVRGKSCASSCISRTKACRVNVPKSASKHLHDVHDMLDRMSKAYEKNRGIFENSSIKVDYDSWEPLAVGNYGKVSISPDKKRVVKQLLVGKDGTKGEFGEHEIELAKKMGELGHSPKIHSHSAEHIEMDAAKGKPLWADYAKKDDEPVMNAAQARKASAAIRDLHKMGYAHGDLHALQFIVDKDNVKLVDFGLSVPVSSQPSRVMQDLAKIAKLIDWKNPELADDSYNKLVNKYLSMYSEVSGYSQAAKAKRARIGQMYLADLEDLK